MIDELPATLCARLSKREIDGSCSSVEFAVVCIESIPAYAGVAVCGYYSWCMSGSLAGQLFSQFFVLANFFGVWRVIRFAIVL